MRSPVSITNPEGFQEWLYAEIYKPIDNPAEVDSPWPLTESPAGCILRWPVTQLDISATRIRQLAANGQDLRYLVPEPVRRYIERNAIYLRAEARAAALANS